MKYRWRQDPYGAKGKCLVYVDARGRLCGAAWSAQGRFAGVVQVGPGEPWMAVPQPSLASAKQYVESNHNGPVVFEHHLLFDLINTGRA